MTMTSERIESLMHEDRVFEPPVAGRENAYIKSMDEYRAVYKRSMDDPEGFWSDRTSELLTWYKKWDKALEWSFDPPEIKWFAGGELNVAYNCLDRHLTDGRRNKAAIIWQGENDKDVRVYTYQMLHDEVCRFANVLKKMGVKRGDRVALCAALVQGEELSARMRPAGLLGEARRKQGFVAAVVIDHERTPPAFEEGGGMVTRTTGLIVEDDHRWAARQIIAAVGPEVSATGLAFARIELLHRRFIRVQAGGLTQQLGQSISQRLQGIPDAPDPFGQCAAGKGHILTRRNLFEPIQRQVIEVFAGGHPGQQAWGSHAAIDDRRIDRRRRHGLAGAAGILRAVWRITKKRAGSMSSCSLMSSPIFTSADWHWPQVQASGS
jgi:hypothetical protein